MKRTVILTILFMFLTTGVAMAGNGSIGLDFNNDSAEGRVSFSLTEDEYGKVLFNGRYLYNSDEDTNLGSAAICFYGEPGNIPGLTIGAGFIGYVGKSHKNDTLNIGLKGEIEYMPAQLAGIGFGAKVGYAPKVFSFRDSDGLIEYSSQVFYAVTPKIHVYLNYQHIDGDTDTNQSIKIDRDLRFGLRGFF
jgi:hypothetical protein